MASGSKGGRRAPSTGRGQRAGHGVAACAALLIVGACGQRPGAILEPGPDAPAWPAPPYEARIRYLGEFRTNQDLKPGRSFIQGVGRTLFGATPATSMVGPMGVCTDDDRLFVADGAARVVHVFDLGSRRYDQWRPPEDVDRFMFPVDVVCDPTGRLLVSDSLAGAIYVFDLAGGFVGTLGDDRLERPVGMALDDAGNVYVADAGAHRVVAISPTDEVVATYGERGSEPGQFNFPTYVAIDSRGRLVVSDSLNFRVQVFDGEDGPARVVGEKGDMAGYFGQPKGIAIDEHDRLFVVDAHFEAVQLFDEAGVLLMSFGREGREAGEFWLPVGVHVDGRGRVFVADSYNRRVQVFELLAQEIEP